jgi:hypothetical protein
MIESCRGQTAAAGIPVLAVTASATTTTTTKPAFLLRLGFIDGQGTTIHSLAVKHGNGFLACGFGFHFHKTEAPGLAGVPVSDNLSRNHWAGLGKKRVQLFFGRLEGQIADVQFNAHIFS